MKQQAFCLHGYLLQLPLSALVPQLHVEDLPLQTAQQLPLGALSLFSVLQILQQSAQLHRDEAMFQMKIHLPNVIMNLFVLGENI